MSFQNSGKLNTGTTSNITTALSAVSKRTGGVRDAESDPAVLQAAFPSSPMLGDEPTYGPTQASAMQSAMTTMSVTVDDVSNVQGYWGYPAPTSEENVPTADLTYNGAPDIPNVSADINGDSVASPYMPNLIPPGEADGAFSPIRDNPTAQVIDPDVQGPSPAPFVGRGYTANPSATSAAIHTSLTTDDEEDINTGKEVGKSGEHS